MNKPVFTLKKNIYLKGDLNGKYEAKPINSFFEDSRINLIETEIKNVVSCSSYESFQYNTNSLIYESLNDVDILMSDDKSLSDYKFKEDIYSVKINDIKLSNHVKDGSTSFGTIDGNAIFCLENTEIFKISSFNKPNEELDILFIDIEKKNKKKKLFNLFKKIIWIILFILFIYFFVDYISNVDYEKKKQDVKEFIDNTITDLNSKTIWLKEKNNQYYVDIQIGKNNQEFLLDTGASMTTVSSNFIKKLINDGYIRPDINFVQFLEFTIADGSKKRGEVWRVPKIKLGSQTLYDINIAVISEGNTPFLLGMSTLEKLGNYALFLKENKIVVYNNNQ